MHGGSPGEEHQKYNKRDIYVIGKLYSRPVSIQGGNDRNNK